MTPWLIAALTNNQLNCSALIHGLGLDVFLAHQSAILCLLFSAYIIEYHKIN